MYKTGFTQKQKYRKVIAQKGLINVWSNPAKNHFQMTFVVFVYATGTVSPSLMIVSGMHLDIDVLQEFYIGVNCVTTASKTLLILLYY